MYLHLILGIIKLGLIQNKCCVLVFFKWHKSCFLGFQEAELVLLFKLWSYLRRQTDSNMQHLEALYWYFDISLNDTAWTM